MHKVCYDCGYKSKGTETHCPLCGKRLTYHDSSSYFDDCECDKKFTTTVIIDRETQTDIYPIGGTPASKRNTAIVRIAFIIIFALMFISAIASFLQNTAENTDTHEKESFSFESNYDSVDIYNEPAVVSAPKGAFGGNDMAIAAIASYYNSIITKNTDLYSEYTFVGDSSEESIKSYINALANEYDGYNININITDVQDYIYYASEITKFYKEYGIGEDVVISDIYYFEANLVLSNQRETDNRNLYGMVYTENGNWKIFYILEG